MKKALEILCGLMLVVFPIWGPGASFFMILSGLLSVYILIQNRSAFDWKLWMPFVAYIAIYAFGILWSDNVDLGVAAVRVRLGMIVLPLIAMAAVHVGISRRGIWSATALGFLVSMVFMGVDVVSHVLDGESFRDSIDGSQLCLPYAHRAYFMNYLMVVLLGWLFVYKEMPKWYSWLFYGFVIAVFWTLQGRMNIVAMMGVYALALLYAILKKQNRVLFGSVVGIAIPLLMLITNAVPNRFNPDGIESELALPEDDTAPTSVARTYVWLSGIEVYKRNPILGVGSGDMHQELNAYFEETGYTFGLERNYNTHNDYIQTLMTLGPIGLLLLLLLFVRPLWKAWKSVDMLLVLWLLYFGVVMMSESYFDRFAGVFLFASVTSFLWATTKRA
ncbi:MAG: O-antigen ligase family protein [Bacteroidetes bacterium]|nr:MAG: O-antigen ligase family protein [Bacteroidota bacterium]